MTLENIKTERLRQATQPRNVKRPCANCMRKLIPAGRPSAINCCSVYCAKQLLKKQRRAIKEMKKAQKRSK